MTSLPPIVGIGASAGGLEALRSFVQSLPNDAGLACVVVQHLAPDHPSIMDKLLGAYTPVEVRKIEDGDAIEPDRVYVVPEGPFLEIVKGRFRLREHEREEGLRTPIDRFFSSLAEAAGREAFAVVLSGTGSDGTMGVRAVKSAGGVAIVQDSASARFPGMPASAVATGLVDFVLRPEDMPGRILDIISHRRRLERDGGPDALSAEVEARLPELLRSVDENGRHAFSSYKPGTLTRRVMRRMTLLRQSSVDGYARRLAEDEEERRNLVQDFLIGVTAFFRDPEHFETLRRSVIGPLLDGDRKSLRIWVPGCSTGEEAYSIAMLVAEAMEEVGRHRQVQIFGTDIDHEALRHARHGRYAPASLDGVGDARRQRFFRHEDGAWVVSSQLREMCVFAPHDVLQDPPFSRLDLVSCRNLLIYLGAEAQASLMPKFHYALHPGGFLALGPSENINRGERFFEAADRNARLYRRNDRASAGFSALRGRPAPAPRQPNAAGPREMGLPTLDARRESVEAEAEQLFLRRFAAPFAVVEGNDEVAHLSEAMTAFVRPPRGAPAVTIDGLLSRDLRLPVQSAVADARASGAPAEVRDVVAATGGASRLSMSWPRPWRAVAPSSSCRRCASATRSRSTSTSARRPTGTEGSRSFC